MLKLKRVDHIAMAAPEWQAQSRRLEKLLGFKPMHDWKADDRQDFNGGVSYVPGSDIEFEIIDPARPTSFVQKFLDESGPSLHHISVEVSDIVAAAEELKRLGLTPFRGIDDGGGWKVTYIHPRESGGILWQIFEPKRQGEQRPQPESDGGVVKLKRIDHVSMAVPDLNAQVEFQERVFGMEVLQRWTDEYLKYDGAVMRIPNSKLQFEMIAPTAPDSFVQKFIETRRPGMHHICCEIESVDVAVEALRQAGIEPHGGIIESDWHRHTFLHPKDSGGVLFQLFEE